MQARLNRYDLMFPVAISYYNVFVNFMLYFTSQVSRPHFRYLYRAPIFVGTALYQADVGEPANQLPKNRGYFVPQHPFYLSFLLC